MMKLKDPLAGAIHFLGAALSIPGLVALIIIGHDSPWKVISFSIYGASMFLLFFFGGLYHWLPLSAGGRYQVFRKLDHLAIYLLIAGTYTPFCLNTLRGGWGWSIFGVVWGMALIGIVVQAFYIDVPRWFTTTIYIAMGWIVLVAIKPLIDALPLPGIIWLAVGGVIYSVGGVIYTIKKPNISKAFGYHELWHTLVLIAAGCHYSVVLFFVAIPR